MGMHEIIVSHLHTSKTYMYVHFLAKFNKCWMSIRATYSEFMPQEQIYKSSFAIYLCVENTPSRLDSGFIYIIVMEGFQNNSSNVFCVAQSHIF